MRLRETSISLESGLRTWEVVVLDRGESLPSRLSIGTEEAQPDVGVARLPGRVTIPPLARHRFERERMPEQLAAVPNRLVGMAPGRGVIVTVVREALRGQSLIQGASCLREPVAHLTASRQILLLWCRCPVKISSGRVVVVLLVVWLLAPIGAESEPALLEAPSRAESAVLL